MDDKVLRQIVIDELDFEPSIDAANIGVAVENGVVTLTGHVGSYAEKRVAERAVQRVRGVRAIAGEEIAVRYSNDKKTANDQIADRAVRILDWYAQIPKSAVKVRNGRMTFAGIVSWQYQRAARIRRPTPVGRHRCDKPHRHHPTGPSRREQRENL